jgi:hypothetical protein
MTSPSELPTESTLSTTETAKHLARELGGKVENWLVWLANERKPNRVNRRLPHEVGLGRPRYCANKIDQFVVEVKSTPVHTSQTSGRSGSPKQPKFNPHISAMKVSEGADPTAVLFAIAKPLAAFMLSAEEARHVASRLMTAADELDADAKAAR